MKVLQTIVFLSCVLTAAADDKHVDIGITGCSLTDGEDMYGLDGEEIWYADFVHKRGVLPQPPFVDKVDYPGGYEQAVANLAICKGNLGRDLDRYKDVPLELDVPHSSIYNRDVVEVGVQNVLVCLVTGFYPAPVQVSWTRNNQNVTEGSSLNTPYPNKDGTFNQFSSLKFTPQPGDIYSCSVSHPSLSEPVTRVWDVEENRPGMGPAVFCGLGLTLGLVGVATGTFFLVKGNQCQ